MPTIVKRLGHLDTSETSIDGKKVVRTATQFYLVIFESANSATAAEIASGIPDVGAVSEGDTSRRFKGKQAKMVDGSKRTEWEVQVDFSNHVEETEENPLDRDDEISWDFDESSQPYQKDEDPSGAKDVVNTAGEPFEQFLERETGSVVATIKRNMTPEDYAAIDIVDYAHTVNDDTITVDGRTAAAGQAKLAGIPAGPIQSVTVAETEVLYREVTFKIKFRRTWKDVIASRGYNEGDGFGNLTPIFLSTTDPSQPPKQVDKPWPLDEFGFGKDNSTDAPHEIEFFPYIEKDFSIFNFT